MKTVRLIVDGFAIGNPGPGGWACILQHGERERVLTGSEPQSIALLAARIVSGGLVNGGYFTVRKGGGVEARRLMRVFVEPETDRVLWLHIRLLRVLDQGERRIDFRSEAMTGPIPNIPIQAPPRIDQSNRRGLYRSHQDRRPTGQGSGRAVSIIPLE